MKYLIQNKKEFAITVAAFIMAVINLIRAIRSHEVSEELIVAVLVTASTVLAWYYNMPTSEENCKYTGLMRVEKMVNKNKDFIGENFFEEHDIWDEGDLDDIDDDDDIEVVECEEQPEDAHDDEVIDDEL